jgi:aminoglycoside phosphotransferase family enzyme
MICFVDRVSFRDRICLMDRVGFRDRIYFVDMVGFVGWKRMEIIKLNQNKYKPATKLNLEHELRTADSKTELCKGLGDGFRSQ